MSVVAPTAPHLAPSAAAAPVTVPIDQGTVTFDLPADWEVHRASINNRPPLTADQIRTALRETVGTPALRELARGRRTAVLIVDDLTRPTPTADFIPYVLEEIQAGGIPPDGTVILGGFATHRPMTRPEYVRKVGADVVARYEYMNHNPFEHLTDVGTTSRGTKVAVNKYYADADLRISLSSVIPHASAGFGGGAKLVLPGVCGIETIAYHHGTFDGERVQIEGNVFRADCEEAARLADHDFSVNVVVNRDMKVAGLFAGDLVAAHRAAVRLARDLYRVPAAPDADLTIVSGHPQDSEFLQAGKALGEYGAPATARPDGVVLFAAAATLGFGVHYLGERRRRGLPLGEPGTGPRASELGDREVVVYSPGVTQMEAGLRLPGAPVFAEPAAAVEAVREAVARRRNGRHTPVVNVIPEGPVAIFGTPPA